MDNYLPKTHCISITTSERDWARAMTDAWKPGPNFNHDLQAKDGVLAGYVGEAAFKKQYPEAEHLDSKRHDFRLWDKLYDLKTYRSDYVPRSNYYNLVHPHDLEARAGFHYFFANVDNAFTRVYLLGWISCELFKQVATLLRQGERQPGSKFVAHIDAWQIQVYQLFPPPFGGVYF